MSARRKARSVLRAVAAAALALAGSAGAFSCDRSRTPGNEYRGYAFGSTYRVLLGPGAADPVTSADLQSALTALERSVSQWQAESDAARFNRLHRTDDFSVTPDTADLLETSLRVSAATGGAFDPTIGLVLELWGFTGKGFRGVPRDADVRAALSHSGYQKLRVERSVIRKSDPRLELNLDGISQGYAADAGAKFLQNRGVEIFLIEVGGEIRAGKSDRGGWIVPIEAADKKRRAVRLEMNASATSARDRNYVEESGKRYGHIIDPQTGKPSDNGISQATSICPDAATADAFATALLVMPEPARNTARLRLSCEFLLLRKDGREVLSPGLRKDDSGPEGQAIYWPVM